MFRPCPRSRNTQRRRDHFGQRHPILKRFRVLQPIILRAARKLFDSVQNAYGYLFSANGAAAPRPCRLFGRKAELAVPVAVKVVFPFFGKKLYRSPEAFTRFQRPLYPEVGHFAIEHIAFAPQFCRRVRVRIGYQSIAVKERYSAVHQRIGGKSRFHSVDLRR